MRHGIVLVSPNAVKRSELADVSALLKVSRLPLLGVITYDREGSLQKRVKDALSRVKQVQRG